jgi:hypothetical protein
MKLAVSDDVEMRMIAIFKSGDNWIQSNFTEVFDEEFIVTVGV